jgi:hypothetical protein
MTTRTLLLVKPSLGTATDWHTVDRDMQTIRKLPGLKSFLQGSRRTDHRQYGTRLFSRGNRIEHVVQHQVVGVKGVGCDVAD